MKHISHLLILCLSLFAISSCSEIDIPGQGSGTAVGKFTIELSSPASPVITTRAEDESQSIETIENVAVFVFNTDGNKSCGFSQSSSENIRYIDVYLTDGDKDVYVVCNHPDSETLADKITSLAELQQCSLSISTADGAYPGHYVMSGHATVEEITGNDNEKKNKIFLSRLAAHLNFTINVDTDPEKGGDGGNFKLTNIYMCNVPGGSFLLDNREEAETNPDGNEATVGDPGCTDDFPYASNPDEMRANYFKPFPLSTQEMADASITASFDMFENRRGSVDDTDENWPELKGLEQDEKYTYYKQLFKRSRAKDYPNHIGKITIGNDESNETLDQKPEVKEGQFYNATYLRIDGIYQYADGRTYKTSYHVYLGADNYKDFNIRRNYRYNHEITIRSYDDFDHRVTGNPLGGLTVYATLDELDAHCNSVKALMYAPKKWTVSVKDPDATPWLEVSHSAVYKPRLLGQSPKGDEAAFSISGDPGLNYFYVHTDDYIPEISDPLENGLVQPRKGYIVCSSNSGTQELEVVQLPAQLVILHIKYDVHTMKEVCDTFFIERKLEQKYMPWGFLRHWSFVTNDLIASGTWDGLSNTRKLYDVGLNGEKDKNGKVQTDPAYPDGLPYDHAIGYVVSKNRDRNGNGKIDYNEIVWYWPATKELEQIQETKALLDFEGMEEVFHASTPSASDPAGITTGFSNSIKMSNGKTSVVRRDRCYNVIACRRKNAWKGPDNGNADGNVTTNPDWEKEEDSDEVIIPKGTK